MHTQLIFSREARAKLQKGIDTLADAVKVTLGPQGRPVTIANPNPNNPVPIITKDGVTVANSIHVLKDPTENMGAQLVKSVAQKTAEVAGDGTTTATILAQVMIREGIKHLDEGANPVDLKRGIEKATENVVESLKKMSRQVDNENAHILSVATISANNDAEIGKIIADIVAKVGKDGLVTIEESKTEETYSKTVDGIQIDRGYISPYFVTDKETMRIEFDNPLILMYDKTISSFREIEAILTQALVGKTKSPLLIIAEDVDNDALGTLAANVQRNKLPVCAIKMPNYGLISKDILEDVAIVVAGTVVSESKGHKLSTTSIDKLGSAEKVVITKDYCLITGGAGTAIDIEQRAKQVRTQLEESINEHEKLALEKRLAKLTNGVGIIYVGGQTEVEMKEKKDRVDDALCATLAAIEEGILPGGGIAYIKAIQPLDLLEGLNADEERGVKVVKEALQAPLFQILTNAGVVHPATIINGVKYESKGIDYGYNAKTFNYEQFFETGVIDPAKVARVAIESAASIANLVLQTECVMADVV